VFPADPKSVDWTRAREVASARLRQQVAAAGYPVDVVTEEIYDPLDWEAQGMARGTPFGGLTRYDGGPKVAGEEASGQRRGEALERR